MTRVKRVEAQSEQLLSSLGIEEAPIDVRYIAEQLGAQVREEPFVGSANLSGILYRDQDVVVIGVNSNEHPRRKRFTIAHEIAHLYLHEGDTVHVDDYQTFQVNFRDSSSEKTNDRREVEANAFAACLLMPESLVRREFENVQEGFDIVDSEWIQTMAEKFEVSVQALVIRLTRLGLLEDAVF